MNIRAVQVTKRDLIKLINEKYDDDAFTTIAVITEIANSDEAQQTITFTKKLDI